MRSSGCLCLLLGVLLVVVPLPGQDVNLMHPHDIEVQKHPTAEDRMARANSLQLREFSASLCLCSGPGHTRGRGVAGHAEELEGHLK
jgi:hypothetical protein